MRAWSSRTPQPSAVRLHMYVFSCDRDILHQTIRCGICFCRRTSKGVVMTGGRHQTQTELMQPHEIPVHWPQLPKDLPLISFLTSLLPSCGAAAESCFNLASEKDVQVQCTHTPSLPRSHLGRLVPAASLRSKKKIKIATLHASPPL
jgi:hypothetical protein